MRYTVLCQNVGVGRYGISVISLFFLLHVTNMLQTRLELKEVANTLTRQRLKQGQCLASYKQVLG